MTHSSGRTSASLRDAVDAGTIAGLQGLVVMRHGDLVFEHYGAGLDFKWGEPLGVVAFGPDTLHDVRSVTKSVTALLYGVALDRGLVPGTAESILAHFPEYADLAEDPMRSRLTIRHALTMSLGLEWHEDVPYTSAANSEIAMELAADRFRFILERPVVEEPGRRWHYCGGATALLGRLVEEGVGTGLPDFARRALFEPLGIRAFEWMAGSDGVASAASGLRLAPRDLARIGQVVLRDGRWDGHPVVPDTWLRLALQRHIAIEAGFDYGYQWYLGSARTPSGKRVPWVGGMGNGGQRLLVMRELDLIVAIAAGNYDAVDQSSTPDAALHLVLDSLDEFNESNSTERRPASPDQER